MNSSRYKQFGKRCAQALLGSMVVLLAACGGGGGDAGTPIFQDTTTPTTPTSTTLVDLALVLDKQTVPNTGTDKVTYTVTALGAGNAALIGVEVPVTVEVDAGAVVTPSAKVTDKTTATMAAVVGLIDKTSRTVTLTAKSGSISKKLSFNVVDSITGSAVADLSVVVDKVTIPNTGTEEASITVTTLDAARSAIGGVAVTLQVVDVGDSVVLDPGNTTTSTSSGQLTRRLKLQNNLTKRTIAVKASSGTVSRTITVDVVDPPAGTVLTASDLTLSISKNSVNNSGSETVDVVARAVDINRNALAGIDVIFRVNSDAVLTPINTKTDAKGEAKATVGIGANRTVRTITVTAESSALKGTRLLSVTGAKLQATVNQPNRLVGEQGTVDYSLLDVNGSPIDGVEIVATGPGAATGRGVTNGQGKWTYSYKAEGNGKMSIKAVGGAGDTPLESFVNVASKPAALDPAIKILSATMTMDPIVVKVNEIGKDVNRAEIRILFRGEKNAPIENVRVHVGLGPNNTSTDGKFSVSETDSPLLSDKNGLVTLSFIPGERASPTDGVKIHACYGRSDDLGTTVNGCLNGLAINPVTLTVVESPLSISIGGDDVLTIGETSLTYIAKFTVLVVDAAGNPKSDVQVSPVIDLLGYGKGYFVYDTVNKKWVISANGFLQCPNEDRLEPDGARNGTMEWNDINGNGIVDLGEAEDINNSLQLDPRKSDVSVAMVGSTKTDINGLATLRIEYPKSIAAWVRYMIKVSAPGVLSPPAWYGRYEPRWLPVLASAIKSENEPAFQISPYGLDTTGYVNSSTDPAVPIGAGCFNKK